MNLREIRHRAVLAVTRHLLTLRLESFVRYAWWRVGGNRGEIRIGLRDGTRMVVRAGMEDHWIVSEIFFDRQYEPPIPIPFAEFEVIVDVGANVGYSCLWFARVSPQAQILAFEPLPTHIAQAEVNVSLNGLERRVDLVAAAASTASGTVILEPAGARSAVVSEGSRHSVTVPAVDWFSRLPRGAIDLLKMDIEGAERPLLADARFSDAAQRIRYVVVEWHDPDAGVEEKRWCRQRLGEAGFDVVEGADYGVAGLLWGTRDGDRHHMRAC